LFSHKCLKNVDNIFANQSGKKKDICSNEALQSKVNLISSGLFLVTIEQARFWNKGNYE